MNQCLGGGRSHSFVSFFRMLDQVPPRECPPVFGDQRPGCREGNPLLLPHSSGHKMNSLKGMAQRCLAVCISQPQHPILGCDLRPPEAPPLQAATLPHTPTPNTAGLGLDSPTLCWPPRPCYCLSRNLAFPSSAFPFVFR